MGEVDPVRGADGAVGGYVTGADVSVSVPARGAGQHLLVVVHDPAVADLLTTTLELADYRVTVARTGAQGMLRLAERRFDLVLFDVTVPDVESLGEGRRFRPADRPPVLFLAPYETLGALVPELGLGRADYVTMPFRVSEVLARVHVLLRGREPVHQGPCYGDLVLDDATCQAWRGRSGRSTSRPPSTGCCVICWPTRNACCRRNRSASMSGERPGRATRSRNSSRACARRWIRNSPR